MANGQVQDLLRKIFARPADPVASQSTRTSWLHLPIAAMTLGGIAVLIALATFLVARFDEAAFSREQRMVAFGFEQQIDRLKSILVPQVDWDDSIAKLDHRFDPDFADINFGTQLYAFNGFSHTFILNGEGKPLYAMIDGKHRELASYQPLASDVATLIASLRKAEALRPPIKPNPGSDLPVTKPIQASATIIIDGQPHIVIASLIQPDLGLVLPKGPNAPVVITAAPINAAMLTAFARLYLLDDLHLVTTPGPQRDSGFFPLRSPTGQPIGALIWKPRQPGAMLLDEMKLGMLLGLFAFGFIGLIISQRSGKISRELIESEQRLIQLAFHDPLTGLPNRAKLFECIGPQLAAIGRTFEQLAVLCVDLDRFKAVNDKFGHQAGDFMIKLVAERLRLAMPRNALVARMGGDEFVVLFPVSGRIQAELIVQHCLTKVLAPIDSPYGRMEPSCSIGAALIEQPDTVPSEALSRADLALYKAKSEGRGCAVFFDAAMDEAHTRRRKIEDSLRLAVEQGGLRMVYQPQVDARRRIHAVEALVRWLDPEMGEIPPDVFVPLAEDCGLILAIGETVLRQVFQETREWSSLGIAVNVSPVQLRAPGFAAMVVQLVANAGIDPARYDIELTETALLGDDPVTQENISALQRLGFKIVLDDFGTGFSSLSLLKRFKVDKIKIDRTFVSSIGRNAGAAAQVRAIIQLGRTLNLGVVAEGVETEAQFHSLASSGCTLFQGYLTGRPVPGDQIAAQFLPSPQAADKRRA